MKDIESSIASTAKAFPRLAPSLRAVLFVVLTAVSLLALVLIQLGGSEKDSPFNADSAYAVLFTGDLFLHGGHLIDWYVAPHYHFFPDGVFSIAILEAQRMGIAPFVGSVALYGAAWAAITAIFWRQWTGHSYVRSMAWAALSVALAFAMSNVVVTVLHAGEIEAIALGQVLFPGLHGGALLASVGCAAVSLALLAPAVWTRRHWILLCCLAIVIVLTTLSDLIFVPWGTAPLLVILVAQVRGSRLPRLLAVGAVIILATGAGYGLSLWNGDGIRGSYVQGLRLDASDSVRDGVSYLWQSATFSSLLPSMIFYSNMVLWFAAATVFSREIGGGNSKPGNHFLIFLAACSFFSVIAPIVSGIFRPAMVRIFLPYLFIGMAILAGSILVAATRLFNGRYSRTILASSTAMTLLAGAWLYAGSSQLVVTKLASCLSARNLKTGAASFWDAAPLILATQHNIRVVPLSPADALRFQWMAKRQWLSPRAPNGDEALMEFAVADKELTEQKIRSVLGAPTGAVECDGRRILLFNPARPISAP